MAYKALFTQPYSAAEMQRVAELGIDATYIEESAFSEPGFSLPEQLRDIDLLVGYNPFVGLDLDQLPALKFIQLVSVGFNHVPAGDIQRLGIDIAHNVGATRFPISEWVLCQLLQIYKKAKVFCRQQQAHQWQVQTDILELTGKTVTFLGAGNIAVETARKLKAFDCRTQALNLNEDPVENIDEVIDIARIDEVLPHSDIVISALPATKETFHLLNGDRLRAMKDTAALVNISRGTVIDQQALIEVLRSGKFRGVALDVFEQEPLDAGDPLWDMENVYITPHNAIFSDLSASRVFELVYGNLAHFVRGEPVEHPVHFDRGS